MQPERRPTEDHPPQQISITQAHTPPQDTLIDPYQASRLKEVQVGWVGIITLAVITLTLLLAVTFLNILMHNLFRVWQHPQKSNNTIPTSTAPLPKILWIYTQNQIQTEGILSQVLINYYVHQAVQWGYEVRYANSWNSYDWLSQKTTIKITKAMHNVQLDEGVSALLKLALLMEHGGLLFSKFDFFVVDSNMEWLQKIFQIGGEQEWRQLYHCEPKSVEMFMPKKQLNAMFGLDFNEGMTAVRPNSQLMRETFQICIDLFVFGTIAQNQHIQFISRRWGNNALGLSNAFEQAINVAVYRRRQQQLQSQCVGVQLFKGEFMLPLEQTDIGKPLGLFLQEGQRQKMQVRELHCISLRWLWRNMLGYLNLIIGGRDVSDISKKCLMYQILDVPKNREIFLDPLPQRKIQLCIIMLEEMQEKTIRKQLDGLSDQAFKDWLLVVPMHQPTGSFGDKVKLFRSRKNQIHNIQHAAIKQCNTKSYAILMHTGQTFNSPMALSNIAKGITPRDVGVAFLSLQLPNSTIHPPPSSLTFSRVKEGIVSPNIKKMNTILNHLRIFSIEGFRYIPQFDLRNFFGQYFQDRVIFLITLLELTKGKFTDPRMKFIARKYAQIWNIPTTKVVIDSKIAIITPSLEEISLQQLRKTRTRIDCEWMEETLRRIFQNKIPFSKVVVLNPGDDFVPVQLKKGPDLIPKIIHQAWLGTSDLPPAKEYLFRKTHKMYPDYQVKLWREDNLTRENFPLTYDILHTLISFNKISPYSKLASVTDILRHEVLYREGGFWKDAGMNLLRPIFDRFLKYKIFLPVDKTFRFRWLQGMCTFGSMPGLDNMRRITGYRNLNRMKLYLPNAMNIAGPIDFRQFVTGVEEYDPDILMMPYETFYPGQIFQHPEEDLCTIRHQQLEEGQDYLLVESGWYLLAHCAQLYPYSYGIEHNRLGNTWQKRKGDVIIK